MKEPNKGGDEGKRDRRRLVEGEIGRNVRDDITGNDRILLERGLVGVKKEALKEYFISDRESIDIGANFLHDP